MKILREANGFTQDQMASYLDVNRSAYANYESGLRDVPLNVLERCSDLFGCELSTLLEENTADVKNELACAFRVDDVTPADMAVIASFKRIARNYMKMKRIASR